MLSQAINAIITNPKRWLLAGLAATVVLVIFMEVVARFALGAPMKPAVIISQILGWDQSLMWLAEILHYSLGLIGFPIGYVVLREIIGLGSAKISGAAWGFILWLGAAGVMAPLAGMGFFFGGGKMVMASFVAHIAYGLVLGIVYGRQAADHG